MNDHQVFDFLKSETFIADPLRESMDRDYLADETSLVQKLLAAARLDPAAAKRVDERARIETHGAGPLMSHRRRVTFDE